MGRPKMSHLRKRSVLPGNLVTMLGDVSELQKEASIFDEMDTADVDEFEIEAEMKQEIDHARGEKEAVAAVLGIEKEEYIRKSTAFFSSTSLNLNIKEPSHERIISFNNNLSIAENFTYQVGHEPVEQPINYEQAHMRTDNLSRDQLVERCEVLESMLEAEKSLNEPYLYSQQVIIDHLAETNEGLLQFFRVKFKLLDPKKKKRKKKKRSKKKQQPTNL